LSEFRYIQRGRQRGASPRAERVPGQWKAVWCPRLRWLGVIAVLALVGVGLYKSGVWLLDPARFPLRHVRIHGELRNLDQAELERMVKTYLGQNFFALDIDSLHATFVANPWIESVSVRRQWPDTLEVDIRERTAFGYWGEDEMVDSNGKRFRPPVLRQSGPWPRMLGPDGHELNLIRVWGMSDKLLSRAGLKLARLVLDQRRAWSMQCANGIEIYLGRDNFAQRLQRFADVYQQVLASQSDRIAAVDMRYSNGFAVRWADSRRTNSGAHRALRENDTAKASRSWTTVLVDSAG
jgi:cell division protein FtsQ